MEKQCNNKLYFVTVYSFEEFSEKDLITKCYVFAPSYASVCKQINSQFSFIQRIDIEEIASDCGLTSILYVPDDSDIISAINNENNY